MRYNLDFYPKLFVTTLFCWYDFGWVWYELTKLRDFYGKPINLKIKSIRMNFVLKKTLLFHLIKIAKTYKIWFQRSVFLLFSEVNTKSTQILINKVSPKNWCHHLKFWVKIYIIHILLHSLPAPQLRL